MHRRWRWPPETLVPALFDVRIVLVGEFLNEAVSLCKLARVANLFISGVWIL